MPRTALALLRSSHAGPSVAVTAIAVVIGATAGLRPDGLVLLALVVLAGQLSVGLGNDWLDAGRDARSGRLDKPVASGDVDGTLVRTSALAAGGASLALSILLGWPAAAAHLLFFGSGWAYNLGLKSTPLSALPYAVGFAALPAVATLSRETTAFPAGWVVASGALLGLAAHFANVLPDIDADLREGVRGLPQCLGRHVTGVATFALLLAAASVAAAGAGGGPIQVIALGVALAISIAGVALVLTRPPNRTAFRLIMLAALLTVSLLATAGSRLLA